MNNNINMNEINPDIQIYIDELNEYYNIKDKIDKLWYIKNLKVHIIPRLWFESWKKYINKKYLKYTFVKKNLIPKTPIVQKHFIKNPKPGSINNSFLIKNLKDFYNDKDYDNKENYVFKEEINYDKDLKIVHEKIWEFFFKKYNGSPEILLDIYKYNNQYLVDFQKLSINLFFLPEKNKIIGDDQYIDYTFNEKRIQKLYLNKKKIVEDIKNKIVLIENKLHINYKDKNFILSTNSLNLWIININYYNISDINLIIKNIYGEKALLKENRKKLLNKNFNESNFNPILIDKNLEKKFIENSISEIISDKIIFVENKNDTYFNKSKNIYKEGLCFQCKKTKILKYSFPCKSKYFCSFSCLNNNFPIHFNNCKCILNPLDIVPDILSKHGICGLKNIGNTCYLNSAIQIISNTPIIINYFLKDFFLKDINVNNPIGSKGYIANALNNILKNLHFNSFNSYNPKFFKFLIEILNENYKGYIEQDAQEFLAYLLDILHEDLNKVIDKPYIGENNSYENLNDKIKSQIEWFNYLKRNQSFIVDLFYGQFKTIIICPNIECQYCKNKFETFQMVSLPIVSKLNFINIKCFFIFYDISIKPIKIDVELSSDDTVLELRKIIGKILNIHPMSFLIVKLDKKNRLKKFLNNTLLISSNISKIIDPKDEIINNFFLIQFNPNKFYYPDYNNYINKDNIKIYNTNKINLEEIKKKDNFDNNNFLFDDSIIDNENQNNKSYYDIINQGENNNLNIKTDNNYGFTNQILITIINIKGYTQNDINSRKNLCIPKIIIIEKKTTLAQLHKKIYKLLKIIFNNHSFEHYFSKINTDNENDNLEFQINNNYPYRLRLVNINKHLNKPCVLCSKINCNNCLIPFDKKLTINDILNKYPLNNNNLSIDNTYFYLNENQKKLNNNWNRDFMLEISFLPQYRDSIQNVLNTFQELNFSYTNKNKINDDSISLDKCFEYFIKFEKLDKDNEYLCEKCHNKQKAKTKIQIYNPPPILIIHLKRFNNVTKIETKINFPINDFNINKYVLNNENNNVYNLYGVIYHSGTKDNGHYYVNAYNLYKKKWYNFDDKKVKEILDLNNEIITKNAYVLFYIKKEWENMSEENQIKLFKKKFVNYDEKISELIGFYKNNNDNLNFLYV